MSISSKQSQARDLKQRTLTCLHKLSDRDTHSSAATELESIAVSLSPDTLPSFLSSISATDPSDKSPVRRHCLRLITVLSDHHGNSLSPYLSKLLSAISRRLRDADSSVRAACVSAASSLSSNLTSAPFLSIAKPFIELLFTEQEFNAQCGAALCLVAVIEGCECPDVGSLRRVLGRVEKLAKCESFKAKAAILAVIGSVVGVKGVLSGRGNVIRDMVTSLIGFLSSDDWAARKAAAEALIKVAEVEKEALVDCKASCLVTFEAKRFDKVKAARETMSQMIDAWKGIPDMGVEEAEPCKEKASDGRCPPVPRTSIGSSMTTIKKRNPLENLAGSTPSADVPTSTARRRGSVSGNENRKGTAMFRKLDRKKPSEVKVDGPVASAGTAIAGNDTLDGDDKVFETETEEEIQPQTIKPGIRRALFNGNGARVVPCPEASVRFGNEAGEDIVTSRRESEDLSLIHKQLIHIENQQANLFDLLQKYIGSSQNSMLSLESRVHGLELTLEEISFDLAAKGRMSQDTAAAMCCKLPGSDFLSSKFRKRTECQPHLPASFETSVTELRSIPNRGTESLPLPNQRNRLQAGRGLVTNPLAEIHRASSRGVVNNTSA